MWDALAKGLIDADAVWDGYAHNLDEVMPEVERLLDAFDDRVVVTSDHGNSFSERA